MNTFSKSSTVLFLVLAACVLAGGSGCGVKDFKPSKIFSLDNAWPFDGDEEEEPQEGTPVRLVGAWTDTVLSKPGQKTQRGFGGRLMFYGEKDDKPILVEGQLVVYAFDEAGREPTDNKPTRRYVFPSDQMKLHMSKSDVGASYSFWLPWDEVGGPKTNVSLICRFEPKGGAVITGEQTRHILPGTMVAQSGAGGATQVPEGEPMRPAQLTLEELRSRQQQAHNGAQLANYESPANSQAVGVANMANTAASMPTRQMTVTSISLPNNFEMPDGAAYSQPVTTSAGQVSQSQQAVQAAPPAQNQQQAVGTQPGYQTARLAVLNGAAVMPQIPLVQNQLISTNAQRPVVPTAAAPIMYTPQNNGFAAPQFLGQQPTAMQGGQPMTALAGATMVAPAAQMGAFPQQQVGMTPQQQMVTVPAQQMVPQQGWQQLPATNGARTAVNSPSPATIPWR